MKEIRFTPHALEKLDILQEWGFDLDAEMVENVVRCPQQVVPGYLNRLVAQGYLDEEHILRVVYEESNEIIVVTLYPGRRGRYES